MDAWVVHNPGAGQRDLRAAVQEACRHFESRGWRVVARQSAAPGEIGRFAAEAVAQNADVFIVAGGDGSLGEALPVLAHRRTALGNLPAGTANVWAQEIGLPVPGPLSTDANCLMPSAQRLADGVVRTMDLGILNGRHFLLYASVGFDAHVVHQIDRRQELKKQIGGWAYYLTGVATAWSFRGTRARIIADGRQMRRRIWSVWCANTQLYGGVLRIADKAYADDGVLDVVIARGHGPLATVRHYAGFILRGIWADPDTEVLRANRIVIQTRRPMALQVDGDGHGTTPAHLSVDPLALRVLVPRDVEQRIFLRPSENG